VLKSRLKQQWPWFTSVAALAVIALASPRLCAAPDDEVLVADAKVADDGVRGHVDLAQNVFHGARNIEGGRKRLNSQLKVQLNELDRACKLTAEQKDKLTLAAQADIRRFFDRFEDLRQRMDLSKDNREAWQKLWPEVTALQENLAAGLFADRSFFAKVVRKTLTEDQYEKYQQVLDERRRFRYRASIETTLVLLESSVAFRSEQHEALVKLLLETTQPPPVFGHYDQYVVLFRISHLPKDQLREVLDECQRKLLGERIEGSGMGNYLVEHGYLTKEEVDGEAGQPGAEEADTPALELEIEP
jgi:hypothetical protein